ncbi:hypothetical protein HAZT_HAZT007849 [Hyalella azteca]|uniref:Uncharacterized protein n=1 Tax=Hyalella azteca TaxID=294128 RepID=A0A6A0H4W7_HYAAZ|nr:hypothetical protein HAZT_HAZT007849 [Hyalella azteca]
MQRERQAYEHAYGGLHRDLCDLEVRVEELRNDVINRRLRVSMADVETMALVLSRSSITCRHMRGNFIYSNIFRLVRFLKEEPELLENALRRCKKLTGTLVTLKR